MDMFCKCILKFPLYFSLKDVRPGSNFTFYMCQIYIVMLMRNQNLLFLVICIRFGTCKMRFEPGLMYLFEISKLT